MKPDEMMSRTMTHSDCSRYFPLASLMYHKLHCQITQNSHVSDLEYYIHTYINVIRNKYINTQVTEL